MFHSYVLHLNWLQTESFPQFGDILGVDFEVSWGLVSINLPGFLLKLDGLAFVQAYLFVSAILASLVTGKY
jgi:hypothetical protein